MGPLGQQHIKPAFSIARGVLAAGNRRALVDPQISRLRGQYHRDREFEGRAMDELAARQRQRRAQAAKDLAPFELIRLWDCFTINAGGA